jgi:predicted small lipoprotein YifL
LRKEDIREMKRYFLAVIAMLLLPVVLAGCGCGGSDVELVSIAVTPDAQTIDMGATQQYTATGTYSDNTTQDITTLVTWSSSQLDVATISNVTGTEGRASGVFTGATEIKATSGSISGTAALTVLPNLVAIAVTPQGQSLQAGSATQYTATGTYSDSTTLDITGSVTWSSSAEAVALISNTAGEKGRATAIAAGATTITATSGQITGTSGLTVTVTPPPPPTVTLVSIKVTPSVQTIAQGATQQYAATGTYSDNTTLDITETVTWGSLSETIATISNTAGSKGRATSIAAGVTTITATSGQITGAASLTVTAPPPPPTVTLVSIKVTPENLVVRFNKTVQYTATGTYSDGSTRNITELSVWSSSRPEVATISNTPGSRGLALTDHTIGDTTITATLDGVSGSTTLIDP